jgi:hypothetical protein
MAKIAELDPAFWTDWVATRPPEIQEMCKRWPPDRLYRMRDTGQRVTLLSYGEDGTVRVSLTGQYNLVTFDREVFGINPNDLTECDLPKPEELVGTMLTEEAEIEAFVDEIRPVILADRVASNQTPKDQP